MAVKGNNQVLQAAREIVNSHIDSLNPSIRDEVNKVIRENPELCYKEHIAHDSLSSFLERQGFEVTRKAHGIDTSFQAESGTGGRLVVICAEYDALPGIGHACGHNLVATAALSAFLGAARALKELGIVGRVRILGTPAEESGGGKVKLIENGAFDPPEDIAAAMMTHPMSHEALDLGNHDGLAGWRLIASHKLRVEFRGEAAHAAGDPWSGRNALDAAVAAYSNVSHLRQQIKPDERIHGVFEDGGKVPNVIPDYTRMNWCIRAPTLKAADALLVRVKECFNAGALATGCSISYLPDYTYADLRVNEALSQAYVDTMASLGQKIMLRQAKITSAGSTDMGNVSHIVPSFHGAFAIPADPGVHPHKKEFAAAAATNKAHDIALDSAKGMASLAIQVILEDSLAGRAREDFETED